jgi:hypothetical protein
MQCNAYFSRSVFGPGGSKKKVISEEIIETVEDTFETGGPDPPKKVARMSCGTSSKSDTQVSVFFISYFIERSLCACHVTCCHNINMLLHNLFHHSSFIFAPTHALI